MRRLSDDNPVIIGFLAVLLCWTSWLGAKQWLVEPEGEREIAPSAQVGADRQGLDEVRQLLIQGQAGKAGQKLEKWQKQFADSPLKPEAMYYAGQICEKQGDFYGAFEKYEEMMPADDGSEYFGKALEAEYAIAQKFLNGSKRRAFGVLPVSAQDEGIKIMERIAERRPGSLLAENALMTLGNYYFDNKKYSDAAYAYEQIIVSYSTSPSTRQARFRAAKAYLASFNGPAFDPAPLIEAKERLLEYQGLYEGDENSGQIRAMLEKIDDLLAERTYQIGCFYQRTGKKQAAAESFRQVAQDWPDSKWAGKAQKKLGKLSG